MLSDARLSMIQQLKGTTTLSIQFIKDFDLEWDAAVLRVRNSGADLSKIPILPGSKEYKKVKK